MEALLRWRHHELGMISPGEFIPIAEDNGLIVEIGQWTLRTVCEQNKSWQDMGYPPVKISVNLSARQFLQKNIPINVLKIDKSFIQGIEADPHNAAIVKAIIDMAHGLELQVIAEGVETQKQLSVLRQLNCDSVQGNIYWKFDAICYRIEVGENIC